MEAEPEPERMVDGRSLLSGLVVCMVFDTSQLQRTGIAVKRRSAVNG
jgi:hypothetical protein